ncbi:MAG: HAD family hydrolase [Gemmatimonadales bacterium]
MKKGNSAAKAILFDFGGTLDDDGIHWPLRFHIAYREAGGELGYRDFEALFKTTDKDLAELPRIRTMGQRAAIAATTALLVERLPDGDRVNVVRVIDTLHHAVLATIARNRPMLERLAARYRLGVVSNFTGNLEPCLTELGIRPLFQSLADSALVGVAKPDPRIFHVALKELKVDAVHTWMVGDNPDADIRPAHALGMRTIWLAPASRPTPEGLMPTQRVAKLTDIESYLD